MGVCKGGEKGEERKVEKGEGDGRRERGKRGWGEEG